MLILNLNIKLKSRFVKVRYSVYNVFQNNPLSFAKAGEAPPLIFYFETLTGQGFADKRKKKAAYDYLKLLKKEKQGAVHSGDTDAPKHRPLDFLRSQLK